MNLLNSCKSLYIISLWEGFGLPALEALACGTKVVSSNKGGLPEIVSGIGTIVNPEDIDQIANTMKEISLENPLNNELSRKRTFKSKRIFMEICS